MILTGRDVHCKNSRKLGAEAELGSDQEAKRQHGEAPVRSSRNGAALIVDIHASCRRAFVASTNVAIVAGRVVLCVCATIGAFVARGLITALFIPDGWIPKLFPSLADWSADVAVLVGPMILYLLPLLIAYTGGKMIFQTRVP